MRNKPLPEASKALGQNYLHDPAALARFQALIQGADAQGWLEIGCGPATLTAMLVQTGKPVVGVELDMSMQTYLAPLLDQGLKILWRDFMQVTEEDIKPLLPPSYYVIGNIPYYITTPILERLLLGFMSADTIFLMVQKEVAERMIGATSATRGRLSIFCQYYAECKREWVVRAGCFHPAPKVDSAVVRLKRKALALKPDQERQFFAMVKAGFHSRRKQLLPLLCSFFSMSRQDVTQGFIKASLKETCRAEELQLSDWLQLFAVLGRRNA